MFILSFAYQKPDDLIPEVRSVAIRTSGRIHFSGISVPQDRIEIEAAEIRNSGPNPSGECPIFGPISRIINDQEIPEEYQEMIRKFRWDRVVAVSCILIYTEMGVQTFHPESPQDQMAAMIRQLFSI